MPTLDLTLAEQLVQRIGRTPDSVIPILQAVQEQFGYLPGPLLERICQISEITPAALSGVSTFYDMFRHEPVGEFTVRVCRGTACHVTGAERVEDALRRRLRIPAGEDTDPDRQFTIEPVACLGCCTLAPVVRIEQSTFGHVTAERVPAVIRDFLDQQGTDALGNHSTEELKKLVNGAAEIHVGLGSCCMAKGSDRLYRALQETVHQSGANVVVKRVGCVGMCHRTPLVEVAKPGQSGTFYAGLNPALAGGLVQQHFRPRGWWRRAARVWNKALDTLLLDEGPEKVTRFSISLRDPGVKAFLGKQVHIATEHFGKLDPLDLDEYLAHDGFAALGRCLGELPPEQIISTIEKSGLRGRGGAGFPTGPKWRVVRGQPGEVKYVICNGDEGDPGAFMDRMILESFPFRVIEGLAIAAVAAGAHEGIFYIRHEYPLAVRRVQAALDTCEKRGWLGEKLLGTEYPLRLSIKEGAGAFVCGEETALIASVEGRRGMPRLRPPFPAEAGLWNKPTLINNVETLALVPWIVRQGAEAFARYGTKTSKGTKVFALAGKIRRGGLIEVPMGTTIREIVEDIGGGASAGHRFKAVQIGGPSGGCVPARLADTPVEYESLREIGAIMGSGGLVVLDDSDCMVDIARYFLRFTQDQSCGKCTFCRIGTKRMLDILERLCSGQGQRQHLDELERLAGQVSQGSLCGLGKTAPNPVLTTLRYFRDEYEAHLAGRCPAGRCQALIHYRVTTDCTGCTLCAQACPVNAIPMTPYQRHEIDQALCTKCDTCRQVCPAGAIELR
jgi:NADH-quinone oxidoreductase subunit F